MRWTIVGILAGFAQLLNSDESCQSGPISITDKVLRLSKSVKPKSINSQSPRFVHGLKRSCAILFVLTAGGPAALFGATGVSSLSCSSASVAGFLNDACTIKLTAAAPTTGTAVSLSSSNANVVVPAQVTVPAGATSAAFTAKVSAVGSAQTAILTASSAGSSTTLALSLKAMVSTMSLSAGSIAFGSTPVSTPVARTITLNSVGNWPLDIYTISAQGTGFSISPVTLPAKLNPGASLTLTVQFDPSAVGNATGLLNLSTNSSTGNSVAVSLSGSGATAASAALSSLSCSAASISGFASDACTVALSGPAPSGGSTVKLSSNNTDVQVPATIVVPAGASAATFTAAVTAAGTAQNVTLTATSAGISKTFALTLKAMVSTMSVSATSLAFGNVAVKSDEQKTITISSVGNWPLNIGSVSVQGAGYSVPGETFPVALNPGQTLSLTVSFSPASAAPAAGSLTISSNSSAGNSIVLSLTGTGTSVSTEPPTTGNTYYLAPAANGGNDANSGSSPSSPWLSPKHNLNCGDVIIAADSTSYDAKNFNTGHWGNVSCPNANNVAWLQCATFDGCKISSTEEGIYVDRSFWGVQGWEVTTSDTSNGFCFAAAPSYPSGSSIHHIIFTDNIANGCQAGGIVTFNVGDSGVDYITIAGNIVYKAIQGSAECYNGISIFQPVQSDAAPGTHIYVADNFAWGNSQPSVCGGVQAWGGDGIIFDTFDGSGSGLPNPYAAQAVIQNNIVIGNGGHGIEIQNNVRGSVHSPIYIAYNTSWGNEIDNNQQQNNLCAEVLLNSAYSVNESYNLVETSSPTQCAGNRIYALSAYNVNGTVSASNNFAFGYNGQNTFEWAAGTFVYNSNNVLGQNASFQNAYTPGAPSCGGTGDVANCMGWLTSNFSPTNTAAASLGHQLPGNTSTDALYPQWLCGVTLPTGLLRTGCP
jgi:hypothetical protein